MTAVDYTTVMAFPADNRTLTLSATVAIEDPLRKALRDPERLDRVFAAFPITAPFIEVADPISDVHTMARIENRWRRLIDAGGRPLVGGFLLVGDSSLHTNPTFGRGISLAFAQAQHLADTIHEAVAEPVAYVASFERWTVENLGVWFESQVAADGARIERLEAGLRGDHLPPPDDPISRFMAGLIAVAQFDPLVARALAKVGHLLITPAELTADREVVHRVMAYLGEHPTIERPSDGPTRQEFEQLVVA
jgi:2-polyprenyl-6-methoxyphenol hydroxylase-like FAD-dependent oxidoreductase